MKTLATLLFSSCLLLAFSTAAPAQEGYKFFKDGKEFAPEFFSLNGDPSKIAEGDVLYVPADRASGLYVTLGGPGEYRFRDRVRHEGKLFLAGPEGAEFLAAVVVKSGGELALDPLATMDEGEVGRLIGLSLCLKTEAAAEKLQFVGRDRCLVEVKFWARAGDRAQSLPPLPPDLKYLRLDDCVRPNIEDLSPLENLRDLSFLWIRSANFRGFDLSLLSGMTGLRHFSYRYHRLVNCAPANPGALAGLKELRHLSLSSAAGGIEDVSFCAGLPNLRALEVNESAVADLSPLTGHPALQYVVASRARVAKLPRAMPKLAALDARWSPVPKGEIDAFREANPGCAFQFTKPPEPAGLAAGWKRTLEEALSGADRLAISDVAKKVKVFEEKSAEDIAGLVAVLEIDDFRTRAGMEAESLGELKLDFYRGENLLGTVVLLSFAKVARWEKGKWDGDAVITEKGAKAVGAWMAGHGIGGIFNGEWRYYRKK